MDADAGQAGEHGKASGPVDSTGRPPGAGKITASYRYLHGDTTAAAPAAGCPHGPVAAVACAAASFSRRSLVYAKEQEEKAEKTSYL